MSSSQGSQPLKIHKFSQRYGFKGPWDRTSKLIKTTLIDMKVNLRVLPMPSITIVYYQMTSLKNHLTLSGNNSSTTDQRTSPRKAHGLLIAYSHTMVLKIMMNSSPYHPIHPTSTHTTLIETTFLMQNPCAALTNCSRSFPI